MGTYNWKKERGRNKRNSKKQESNNNKEVRSRIGELCDYSM